MKSEQAELSTGNGMYVISTVGDVSIGWGTGNKFQLCLLAIEAAEVVCCQL